MKAFARLAGCCNPIALALLYVTLTTSAQAPKHLPALPLSPISSTVLVARMTHSGRLPLPAIESLLKSTTISGSCTPTPCVLPNVQASEVGAPVNETPLVSNPRNKTQLLAGGNDFNCASSMLGFYTSSNSGSTWTHTCMGTLPGQVGLGHPGVGYDRLNTAYAIGIDANLDLSGSSIVFEKSTNNGATWTSPAVAVTPTISGGFTDKPWLQIDTNPGSPHLNTLYISVTQFDSPPSTQFFQSQISVSNSRDHGKTWSTATVDTALFPDVDQFSDLAIDTSGTVYVSWMRCTSFAQIGCGGTTASLMVSKSRDSGNTWSSPVVLAAVNLAPGCGSSFYGCLPNTSEPVSEIPAMGVDNSGGSFAGRLYAVMYNWTGTFMQVQVSSSTDHGATWGSPVTVAPPTATNDQFFPWLSVSKDGTVGVTWLDRRNDPNNVSYEAFASLSSDGGTTFPANIDLSSAPSNPFNDGFGGGFMGDNTGNTWVNPGPALRASWTDTRSGVAQNETGGYRPE